MGRKEKPEILKKELVTVSLPRTVVNALKAAGGSGSKSELVAEILTENLDRITGGDVRQAIDSRRVQLRDEVLDVLRQSRLAPKDNEQMLRGLAELKREMQQLKDASGSAMLNFKGIDQRLQDLAVALSDDVYKDELLTKICERVYESTDKLAEQMYKV